MTTVQGCLEAAFTHIGVQVRLEPAARTDAGVHAIDQVVTFTARAALEPAALRAAINTHTPPAFHARASARSRTYVYLVGWPAPAELAGYAWSLPDARAFPDLLVQRVDLARAADALARIPGEHDF